MFSNSDLTELVAFRRHLHTMPEVSGEERETAATVAAELRRLGADQVVTGLGGHGVAGVFGSGGPTVLIRSELDALPIHEVSDIPHRSQIDGRGHMCGHDGHSTILLAVARILARNPVAKGRVVLMFQPAEENGMGAAAVLADPNFAPLTPDFSFSLHNMPGVPLGAVAIAEGPVNCASRGIRIALTGRTAHASQPETGVAPTRALAQLIEGFSQLNFGTQYDADFRMVTITHLSMGEAAFGIAPGQAELWATLRTLTDDRMDDLVARAEELVANAAADLAPQISYHDVFRHCENHPEAVAHLTRAFEQENIPITDAGLPMRGSEDFGRFRDVSKSAMFLLGAGVDNPHLHNPDYDFPDDLIPIGARVFLRVIRNLLG